MMIVLDVTMMLGMMMLDFRVVQVVMIVTMTGVGLIFRMKPIIPRGPADRPYYHAGSAPTTSAASNRSEGSFTQMACFTA